MQEKREREQEGNRGLQSNQRMINKMAEATYLPIITLNINSFNPQLKRYINKKEVMHVYIQ